MFAIIMLAFGVVGTKVAEIATIRLVDGMATTIAAYYCWRRNRLSRVLLATAVAAGTDHTKLATAVRRAQRRAMARHFRLSIAMTEHYSLFPASSERGYAVAHWLAHRAR